MSWILPESFPPDKKKLNSLSRQTLKSTCSEETIEIGKKIAKNLNKGSIVAIKGKIGAGKTCLVKGIGQFFGIEDITSPTYTIISEHEAKFQGKSLAFYHIDAYRLNGDDDFSLMGGEEYLYGSGIAVIEWSERISGSIPANAIYIEIEVSKDNSRIIHIINMDNVE